jgi:PilZ domain
MNARTFAGGRRSEGYRVRRKMQAGMEEHRKAPRHRTYKAAHIAFVGRAATIDCVVRNLSDTGAILEVASPIGIPDAFDLVFKGDDPARPCRVTWRKETKIGVEFR